MYEKVQSQNVSGMLGNSEKVCGAGTQNIYVCGQIGGSRDSEKRKREKRGGLDLY